jgi:hypothetical protein
MRARTYRPAQRSAATARPSFLYAGATGGSAKIIASATCPCGPGFLVARAIELAQPYVHDAAGSGFNVAQRARGLSELRDLVGRTRPSKLALALWLKFFTVGAGFLPGARSCLMSRALIQDLRRSPGVADVMLLAMASVHGGLILLEHADRPRRCGAAWRDGRLDRRRLLRVDSWRPVRPAECRWRRRAAPAGVAGGS